MTKTIIIMITILINNEFMLYPACPLDASSSVMVVAFGEGRKFEDTSKRH